MGRRDDRRREELHRPGQCSHLRIVWPILPLGGVFLLRSLGSVCTGSHRCLFEVSDHLPSLRLAAMAAGSVLHMVIVGAEDVPLFEADLSTKSTDAAAREVRLCHWWFLFAQLASLLELRLPVGRGTGQCMVVTITNHNPTALPSGSAPCCCV